MEKLRSVEQRWSPRQSTVLDASFRAGEQRTFPGRIQNISIGGLRIETGAGRLRLYGEVYVAFTDQPGEVHDLYRLPARTVNLPARAVWISNNHAGLMFSHFDASTARLLREVLDRLPPKISVTVKEARHETKPELPVSQQPCDLVQDVSAPGLSRRTQRGS